MPILPKNLNSSEVLSLTGILLLSPGFQLLLLSRLRLRGGSKHIHGQLGLRVHVGHPVVALGDAGADGAGAVPAGQHAGGLVREAPRLGQRAGESQAGDELELVLLGLLLQLQLQDVLDRKRRGGRG